MKLYGIISIILLSICLSARSVRAQTSFETVKTFQAEEAHQAVAVDDRYYYAIEKITIAICWFSTGIPGWFKRPRLNLYSDETEIYGCTFQNRSI